LALQLAVTTSPARSDLGRHRSDPGREGRAGTPLSWRRARPRPRGSALIAATVQPGVEADAGPRISRMPSRAQGDSGRFRAIQGHPGTIRGPMRGHGVVGGEHAIDARLGHRQLAHRRAGRRRTEEPARALTMSTCGRSAVVKVSGVRTDGWAMPRASARSFLLTNEVDKAGGVKRVGRAREAKTVEAVRWLARKVH